MTNHRYILTPLLMMVTACQQTIPEENQSIHPSELTIIQSNDGWSIEQFLSGKTIAYEMNNPEEFSPKTQNSCPDNPIRTIKLPVETKTLIRLSATTGIKNLCIPELNIQSSAVPGLIQTIDIHHANKGLICGTCKMENGELDTTTTLVFEFFNPQHSYLNRGKTIYAIKDNPTNAAAHHILKTKSKIIDTIKTFSIAVAKYSLKKFFNLATI